MRLLKIVVPTRRVSLRLACVPLSVLLGCGTTPGIYEQRMQDTYAFIAAWDRALRGEAEDRGWSMLADSARAGFEDEAQYVALAEAADWSTFELTPLVGHCDDLYACSISVLVPGGVESVPAFLLASPRNRPDAAYWLLHFNDFDQDGEPDAPDPEFGNAQVQVWWERVPWPDPGIGGGGG